MIPHEPSSPTPLGDWICYNSHNELQPHNLSHRIPTTPLRARRSKLKYLLTTLFRKRNSNPNPATPTTELIPHTDEIIDNDNEHAKWTCHSRSLMRYETPQELRLGDEVAITCHDSAGAGREVGGCEGGVCVSTASTLVAGEWGLQRVEGGTWGGEKVGTGTGAGEKRGVRLITPTTPMTPMLDGVGEGDGGVSPRSLV